MQLMSSQLKKYVHFFSFIARVKDTDHTVHFSNEQLVGIRETPENL